MANLLAKSKKYILCFLAAVALIFGVTGAAMLSDGRSVSAAETGHWMSHNGLGEYYSERIDEVYRGGDPRKRPEYFGNGE